MTKKFENQKFENPAMDYITAAQETEEHTATTDTAHNTLNTSNTEKTHRSRKTGTAKKDYRLNLLIPRELRDKLQALADFDRRSLNALINDALSAYADGRDADYQTYTAFLKKTESARRE